LLYLTQSLAAGLALSQGALTHLGWIQVWHIWILGFLSSAVLAFDQPSRQAMLPQLVPREDFMSAITLMALTFNGASVLGPALAGLLVPAAGYASTFYLNGVSFAAVMVALRLMRLPAPAARPPQPAVLRQIRDGLVYIWRHRTVRALALLAAAFGFFGAPYNAMLPVYRVILGIDERALGFLSSAPGLGTVLGGLALTWFAHARHKGRILLASVGLFVLTLVAFSISRHYALSLGLLVLVGASVIAFATTTQTLLQHLTDDRDAGPGGEPLHGHGDRVSAPGRPRPRVGDRPDRGAAGDLGRGGARRAGGPRAGAAGAATRVAVGAEVR
jgi:predicted MFS family arabinose efflux permease